MNQQKIASDETEQSLDNNSELLSIVDKDIATLIDDFRKLLEDFQAFQENEISKLESVEGKWLQSIQALQVQNETLEKKMSELQDRHAQSIEILQEGIDGIRSYTNLENERRQKEELKYTNIPHWLRPHRTWLLIVGFIIFEMATSIIANHFPTNSINFWYIYLLFYGISFLILLVLGFGPIAEFLRYIEDER